MSDDISLRAVESSDEPFLWRMLVHAAHESSLAAVKTSPDLIRYVRDWGRAGDLGMVAEQVMPVGAAWLRLWSDGDRGYGYLTDEIPELAIAVLPKFQAQGIGTALLKKVLVLAQPKFPAVCLSTRMSNPALRLYQRLGFIAVTGSEVKNRVGDTSMTMVYKFAEDCL